MARLLVVEDNGELAALIAAAATSRGHSARTAFTGQAALLALQAERFDAAVVDLSLPDLPGRDVLGYLGTLGVPAIAMSGVYRTDQLERELEGAHAVREFFEKPFRMADLLEAVQQLTEVTVNLEVNEDDEITAVAHLPPTTWVEAEDELTPLATRAATDTSPFEAGFTGPLGPSGAARVLLALARDRDSGELLLRWGDASHRIALRDGQPLSVHSTRAEDGLTAYCIRLGRFTEEALPEIAQLTDQGYTPGEAMLQLSLLTDDERAQLETEHLRAVLHSTFFWSGGEYAVSRAPAADADRHAAAGSFPYDFVFRGLLQPQEPAGLRDALPSDRVLHPTEQASYAEHWVSLSRAESELLTSADGTKSVADLLLLSELPEAESLSALLAFVHLGFLETRAPQARPGRISFGL